MEWSEIYVSQPSLRSYILDVLRSFGLELGGPLEADVCIWQRERVIAHADAALDAIQVAKRTQQLVEQEAVL